MSLGDLVGAIMGAWVPVPMTCGSTVLTGASVPSALEGRPVPQSPSLAPEPQSCIFRVVCDYLAGASGDPVVLGGMGVLDVRLLSSEPPASYVGGRPDPECRPSVCGSGDSFTYYPTLVPSDWHTAATPQYKCCVC